MDQVGFLGVGELGWGLSCRFLNFLIEFLLGCFFNRDNFTEATNEILGGN